MCLELDPYLALEQHLEDKPELIPELRNDPHEIKPGQERACIFLEKCVDLVYLISTFS